MRHEKRRSAAITRGRKGLDAKIRSGRGLRGLLVKVRHVVVVRGMCELKDIAMGGVSEVGGLMWSVNVFLAVTGASWRSDFRSMRKGLRKSEGTYDELEEEAGGENVADGRLLEVFTVS